MWYFLGILALCFGSAAVGAVVATRLTNQSWIEETHKPHFLRGDEKTPAGPRRSPNINPGK